MGWPAGVYDIKFKETSGEHKTAKDTRTGTVTIRYTNGTRREFSPVRRPEFFRWWQRAWKRPPRGISLKS